MAKGAVAKKEVMTRLVEVFPDAFTYNGGKEVRINLTENGEPVQIKVTLTCAKTPVSRGEDTALPGAQPKAVEAKPAQAEAKSIVEPTAEEIQTVSDFMTSIGMV